MGDLLPVLNQTAIDSSHLKLEVTESIILADPDKAEQLLNEIKGLGVSMAIDDFGTGYSSLSYLHRYPFDTLKIDKLFIDKMLDNDKFLETVRIINMLASSLGMSVVAEGVEKEEELLKLKELDCNYAQGYLFARPLPAEKMTEILADNPKW